MEALEACQWNISQTARYLGVDRTTIHRRIKRAGVSRRYQAMPPGEW
ncbi:helix-turn-helix domain-containing protein [Veronia pacifica]|nr:helix-turn-helix domain-containing protein [Veronia pacifica]